MQDVDPDKLQEKLATLRKLRADWGPGASAELDAWEGVISRDMLRAEYVDQDVTRQILIQVRANIARISRELSENEDLDEKGRQAYIGERRVWRWFLALLSKDYRAEIATIDRSLDKHIQASEED